MGGMRNKKGLGLEVLQGSAGPWLDWFGSSLDRVQENRTGSRYKGCKTHFCSFPSCLSLSSYKIPPFSLCVFFSDGGGGRRQPPTRRLAAMDGGAATPNTPFFYIFFVLSTPFHSLYSFLALKFPRPLPKRSDLRKEKKKIIPLTDLDRSGTGMRRWFICVRLVL